MRHFRVSIFEIWLKSELPIKSKDVPYRTNTRYTFNIDSWFCFSVSIDVLIPALEMLYSMLHFITELVLLFSTTLFLPTKRLSIFFHDNVTLGAVTYVTKFLENHSPNNVTNCFISTLSS